MFARGTGLEQQPRLFSPFDLTPAKVFYRRRTALTRHQFGGLIAAAARDLNPAVITRDIAIIESGAVTVWYSRFVPARKRGPGV